jgi:hypothetical protein
LFFNFCHKNLHIFALPSSAVLKPAQAGLVQIARQMKTILWQATLFQLIATLRTSLNFSISTFNAKEQLKDFKSTLLK